MLSGVPRILPNLGSNQGAQINSLRCFHYIIGESSRGSPHRHDNGLAAFRLFSLSVFALHERDIPVTQTCFTAAKAGEQILALCT